MQAVAEIVTRAGCASMQDILGDIAPRIAQRAAHADAEDRFVAENYADLKASGLIAAAIPAELGGLGASHPDLCEMLRRIGAACGSTEIGRASCRERV